LVGGTSAGGNFAAVVSHLYLNDKLSPPLTGAFVSIPVLIAPQLVPDKYKNMYLSREQNKDGAILGANTIALFDSKWKLEYLLGP